MDAVVELPEWEEVLERNPSNRQRILDQDRARVHRTMERWMLAYCPCGDELVPGPHDADAARSTVPTLVFRSGESDAYHTRATSEAVAAALPDARLVEPPWGDREWIDRSAAPLPGEGKLFDRWPSWRPRSSSGRGRSWTDGRSPWRTASVSTASTSATSSARSSSGRDVVGIPVQSRTEIPTAKEVVLQAEVGGSRLQLAQQLDQDGPIDMGTAMWKLYVDTDDCQAVYDKAIAAGCESVSPPQQLDRWPVTVAFIKDPDGYLIEFVQNHEGKRPSLR